MRTRIIRLIQEGNGDRRNVSCIVLSQNIPMLCVVIGGVLPSVIPSKSAAPLDIIFYWCVKSPFLSLEEPGAGGRGRV